MKTTTLQWLGTAGIGIKDWGKWWVKQSYIHIVLLCKHMAKLHAVPLNLLCQVFIRISLQRQQEKIITTFISTRVIWGHCIHYTTSPVGTLDMTEASMDILNEDTFYLTYCKQFNILQTIKKMIYKKYTLCWLDVWNRRLLLHLTTLLNQYLIIQRICCKIILTLTYYAEW